MQYFKNSDLIPILTDWQQKVKEAKANGETEVPEMPRILCEAMIQFAHKITSRGNFREYTWRDLMISSIIETLWKRTENFNPEISTNLYGYWSRIAWNCCVAEINKEKLEMHKKAAMMTEMDIDGLINDDTVEPHQISEFVEYVKTFSKNNYNASEPTKEKQPRKKRTLKNSFESILLTDFTEESAV